MAIARLGSMVEAVSGSLGAYIFKQTKRGTVVTTRPVKKHYESQDVTEARALFATIRAEWAALPLEDKYKWATYAQNYTYADRLGVRRTITGRELFFKVWMSNGPPLLTIYAAPPGLGQCPQPTAFSITAYDSSSFTVQFSHGFGLSAGRVNVFAQRMYTTTWAPPPPIMPRIIQAQYTTSPSAINCSTALPAKQGQPEEGELIWVRIVINHAAYAPSALSLPISAYRAP